MIEISNNANFLLNLRENSFLFSFSEQFLNKFVFKLVSFVKMAHVFYTRLGKLYFRIWIIYCFIIHFTFVKYSAIFIWNICIFFY